MQDKTESVFCEPADYMERTQHSISQAELYSIVIRFVDNYDTYRPNESLIHFDKSTCYVARIHTVEMLSRCFRLCYVFICTSKGTTVVHQFDVTFIYSSQINVSRFGQIN